VLRRVVIIGYVWGGPIEEKAPQAEASIDDMIDALTRPLTPEEANPEQIQKEVLPPVEVTAESYESAIEEFNSVFLDNRWGDGLALIPPTKEAVEWMLTGTSRSPDEVIGKVAVKDGIATVEKIAINAVMAGAKPEYLPVIIAAMEGLTGPTVEDFDLVHVQASMGNFTLAVIVSGPIGKEINMNSGMGFLGEGWRANATIGRAIKLNMTNLGHMWPGVNAMPRVGRAAPYTLYTLAENREFSPWEPYHVAQGYEPEDSCVTVSTTGSYGAWGLASVGAKTGELALDNIVNLIVSHRWFALFDPVYTNPGSRPRKYILLVSPETANGFKSLGFDTQESLRNHICESTSVPYEELSPEEIQGIQGKIEASIADELGPAQKIHPERLAVYQEALKPGGKVPLIERPREDLHIVVMGYPVGGSVMSLAYHSPSYKWRAHETRLIRGATLTEAGR